MANDNILKLKVDSKEYDSKLERARQGLLHLEQSLQKAGKSFNDADKSQVAFVRELGQMSTVATSAKGKLGELTKAYTDLSVAYKNMSEEAKKGELGKALASSLNTLRSRITETKQQLKEITDSISGKESGGLFGGGKMSGMLQVFGGNILTKAAGMALGAITNLANEIQGAVTEGIELAKAGEGIRMAFDRLNNPGLLDNLREATHGTVTDIELMKAAVQFNDFKLPLKELGTMLAFAQQKAKDTGQSVDYMVNSIVTGLGRKSLMILDNLGLSASEVKEKMKETGDMTTAVGAIIRDQMKKAGDYVETAADRATKADVELKNAMEELGRTFQPLSESANNMWASIKIGAIDLLNNAVKPLIDSLTEAGRLRREFETLNGGGGNGQTRVGTMLGMLRNYSGDKQGLYNRQMSRFIQLEAQAWKEANDAKRKYYSLQQQGGNAQAERKLYDQWQNAERRAKAWNRMSSEYQTGAKSILNPEIPTTTTADDDKKKKKTKTDKKEIEAVTGSIDEQAKKVADLQKAWRAAADDDSRKRIKKQIDEAQLALDILMGKSSGLPTMNYGLSNLAGTSGSGLFQSPLFKQETNNWKPNPWTANPWKLDDKAMEAVSDLVDKLSQKSEDTIETIQKATVGLSQVRSGLEQMGIKLPEGVNKIIGVVQGVFSVIQGAQAVIELFNSSTAAAEIASESANTAAVVALTSAVTANTVALGINAAMPFAGGGVVRAAGGFSGIVPGTQYSGDNVPALLDSGEVVLNRAQAGVLADALQDGGGNRGYTPSYVSGEQIWIALNNFTKRTGRGEIITWR